MEIKDAYKMYYDGGISKLIPPEQTFHDVLARIKTMKRPILDQYYEVPQPSSIPQYVFTVNDNFRKYRATVYNSNGKGHTHSQALASGIMEMVERYSCFKYMSFRNNNISSISRFKDLKNNLFTINSIFSIISKNKKYPDKSIISEIEYANMAFYKGYTLDGTQTCIPVNFLRFFVGTNGMAAGNSFEEALMHAICEVIERHCLATIYLCRLETPTIDTASIDNPIALELLSRLKFYNKQVIIKDFSLGLGIPVIGIIRDIDNRYCLVTAGVATDYNEALIRALTESSQADSEIYYEKIASSKHYYTNHTTIQIKDIQCINDINLKIELEVIEKILDTHNMKIMFVDMTDDELKIPSVMVFITNAKKAILPYATSENPYLIALTEENLLLENYQDAAQFIASGKNSEKKSLVYTYYEGLIHEFNNRFDEASDCFETVLEGTNQNNELVQRCLSHGALCYSLLGEKSKLGNIYTRLLELYPGYPFNWHEKFYQIVLPFVIEMREDILFNYLKQIRKFFYNRNFPKMNDKIHEIVRLNYTAGNLFNLDFLLAIIYININEYEHALNKLRKARGQNLNEPLLEYVYSECLRLLYRKKLKNSLKNNDNTFEGRHIMPRIKISDLPEDMKVGKEEMKKIMGGWKVEEGESILSKNLSVPLADPRPNPYTKIDSNIRM